MHESIIIASGPYHQNISTHKSIQILSSKGDNAVFQLWLRTNILASTASLQFLHH